MTNHQDRASQQLEMRLLSVIKDNSGSGKLDDLAEKVSRDAQQISATEGASEHDISIYRKIANNYFDSLRKG